MHRLTSSEQLILGMLAEQPRHGYEIEELINERGMREWTDIGFSSIYYLLSQLEKKGFIAHEAVVHARKIYHITPLGITACRDATLGILQSVGTSPHLIGLANSPLISSAELQHALLQRKETNRVKRDEIHEVKKQQSPQPVFAQAIFDYVYRQFEAEDVWIDATIQQLKEEMMNKVDFKKTMKGLYSPTNREWEAVDVPEMNYVMIDGEGDPNTAESYSEVVEALFSIAYTVKFMSKRQLDKDYAVLPLEGLWWADNYDAFIKREKSAFKWTMMIMQPEWITESMVHDAVEQVRQKKSLPALSKLRFAPYKEGSSLQLLHVGSYDDEAPKLAFLHDEYMPAHELTFNGHHHEIYLGDPRKSSPETLKTILRQPVTRQ